MCQSRCGTIAAVHNCRQHVVRVGMRSIKRDGTAGRHQCALQRTLLTGDQGPCDRQLHLGQARIAHRIRLQQRARGFDVGLHRPQDREQNPRHAVSGIELQQFCRAGFNAAQIRPTAQALGQNIAVQPCLKRRSLRRTIKGLSVLPHQWINNPGRRRLPSRGQQKR